MTAQKGGGAPLRSSIAMLGLLVMSLVTSVSLSAGTRLTPLGLVDSTADGGEWFYIGRNLALFGVVGNGSEPWLHRPPGYPAWVAIVLRLALDPGTIGDAAAAFGRGLIALRLVDSLLLGLSSLLMFLWLARRLRVSTAFAAAVLLGTNAYALVMATLTHYDMLQWTLLIGLVLVLDLAFARRDRDALGLFFGVGVCLGVATLVRPVTLLAPLTLLPLCFSGGDARRSRLRYLVLVAGMVGAIAPWTLRNAAVSGRLIPVNVQGWTAVFGSTSEVVRHDPDRYEWSLLTLRHYMPIFERVTGRSDYDFETYAKHVLPLEDAARDAALDNIIKRPHVYLMNVSRAAISLTLDVNAVLLSTFTRIQSGEPFDRRWILIGVRRAMARGPEAHVFQALHDLLLGAAFLGGLVACRRQDVFLAPAIALWAAILATHSLSYLDFYYYSVKMPFLVAFAFYGLDALPRPLRYGLIGGVSALSLGLSWSMRLLG